jgi:molybdopterin synthase catalytic subunit
MQRVRIQQADFDLSELTRALSQGDPRVGAVCSFVGLVRERGDLHGVHVLELEHYPGMTERSIEAIIDQALRRFDVFNAHVTHRVGQLGLGEQIVWVGVSSAHRGQAYQACEFIMDFLKTQAPFWKKEHSADGQTQWVDARVSDDASVARWGGTGQLPT